VAPKKQETWRALLSVLEQTSSYKNKRSANSLVFSKSVLLPPLPPSRPAPTCSCMQIQRGNRQQNEPAPYSSSQGVKHEKMIMSFHRCRVCHSIQVSRDRYPIRCGRQKRDGFPPRPFLFLETPAKTRKHHNTKIPTQKT